MCCRPDKARRQHHPQGRKDQGGRCCGSVAAKLGLEAAVEQDDRQRQRANEIGRQIVVETDAEQAVFSGEKADAEKEQKKGRAKPLGNQTRQRADRDEGSSDKNSDIDGIKQGEGLLDQALRRQDWILGAGMPR